MASNVSPSAIKRTEVLLWSAWCFLFDCKQLCSLTYFRRSLQYQTSSISVHWEPRWYIADRRTERQTDMKLICSLCDCADMPNSKSWITFYHQLDAQTSCLFTYNTLIKILYMFRALPCSSSGGLHRNCTSIYAVSGIITVCRWLSCAPGKKELYFLNRCTGQSPAESDDTGDRIYTITKWTSWRWAG